MISVQPHKERERERESNCISTWQYSMYMYVYTCATLGMACATGCSIAQRGGWQAVDDGSFAEVYKSLHINQYVIIHGF